MSSRWHRLVLKSRLLCDVNNINCIRTVWSSSCRLVIISFVCSLLTALASFHQIFTSWSSEIRSAGEARRPLSAGIMRPGKVPKTKIRRIRLVEQRRLRLHRQRPGAGNPPLPMYAPHFYSHLVCLLQFCCPWVCSSCLVSVMNIDTVARPLWSPDELLFQLILLRHETRT